MKKLLIGSLCAILLSLSSCGNTEVDQKTHTHEDGSTHGDHDTVKPKQEEFTVSDSAKKDSSAKEHTHADGKKHSH